MPTANSRQKTLMEFFVEVNDNNQGIFLGLPLVLEMLWDNITLFSCWPNIPINNLNLKWKIGYFLLVWEVNAIESIVFVFFFSFHFNKSIANLIFFFRFSNSVWKHLDSVLILYGGFGEEKGIWENMNIEKNIFNGWK